MLAYHLRRALHSIARDRTGSALAILAIGLGIGAAATMGTLLAQLSRDPLPGRSGELFQPHLDASPPGFGNDADDDSLDPGAGLTWTDARNLLAAGMAPRQAIMAGGRGRLAHERASYSTQGRYATSAFFDLFGVPFLRGSGWTAADDASGARVVVLSAPTALRLFGRRDPVGQPVLIEGRSFLVTGVTADWRPKPLFYGGSGGDAAYREDGFYLPLQAAADLALPFAGSMACWERGGRTGDGCAWLQFWVRLPANSVDRYRDFLAAYARRERARGRHVRVARTALVSVRQRLRQLQVVPREVAVQCGLALAFLAVCLLDTAGLLMARFLAREPDVGICRAMGATRRQVMHRFVVESALLGILGGAAGAAFAAAGLWLVRRRPEAYASLAHLQAGTFLWALVASLAAAVCAGWLPAWRACRAAPAVNLRSA